MKAKKTYGYFRVATKPHKNAWLFDRKDRLNNDTSLKIQMAILHKKCVDEGYTVIGETIAEGDSHKSLYLIRDILNQNTDIDFILSPSVLALSQNNSEALETVEYMYKHGVTFLSADDGELKNPRNDLLVIKDLCDDMLTDSTEKPMLPPMSL